MRWQSGRRSGNVLDRRGISLGRGAVGGGALIAALIATLLGAPQSVVRSLLEGGGGEVTETESGRVPTAAEEEAADFVKVVLGSTEDVWTDVLPQQTRRPYEPPKLVLFTEAVQSACGIAGAAVGPFYCPLDSRIYLDLSFFGELAHRFGAPGDFAQAYVVAHEIGHHVQNLLGIADKVRDQRSRLPPAQSNQISVANELQADCVAGVWAYHANKSSPLIEPGDAEEGLAAASAIGDDRLQQQARGRVMPESFTHGSSAQRVRWFKAGLASGRMADCDTFTRPGGGL
ncbi:MAG TPA: neutral zinc metallopeptidase [Polyangia bacterium]|nr:neutral zinc metallopeptidase [Polyangia bacterium]